MHNNQWLFFWKAKHIDIVIGNHLSVVLNEKEAAKHGIWAIDTVDLLFTPSNTGELQSISLNADLSTHLVSGGEIGITKDTYEKFQIEQGSVVWIAYNESDDISIKAIRKKLLWKEITQEELKSIIKDISKNRLSNTMITYYVASGFMHGQSTDELLWSTKASAELGDMFSFDWIVADKHSIGGIPANETTMAIVPIIASLGIKIPKTFTKAITSPCATGDCVNVLMDSVCNKEKINDLIKKNNACLAWYGGLNLAPANSRVMEITYPLSMEPYDKMVSSIMASKYAMGVTHTVIEIPIWATAKVKDKETAKKIMDRFVLLGKALNIKIDFELSDGSQPLGLWIWSTLQVRDVLRILQQKENKPELLENKIISLSAKLLELIGVSQWQDAIDLVKKQLVSWAAWEKMQEIIKSQSYDDKKITVNYFDSKPRDLNSENLKLADYFYDFIASFDGEIKSFDLKKLGDVARILWCPIDPQAGMEIFKKIGDTFVVWEKLFRLYTTDKSKLELAIKALDANMFVGF